MLDCETTQSAVPPESPQHLLHPPAVVHVIDLNDESFSPALRGVSSLTDLLKQISQNVSPAQFEAQAEQHLPQLLQRLDSGRAPSFYDGHFMGSGGEMFPNQSDLREIPPIRPVGNNPLRESEPLIYVNGITTTLSMCRANMQAIADKLRIPVVGLYNATDGDVQDVLQAVTDKFQLAENPAVISLATQIEKRARAGESMYIVGDSHGALITSVAFEVAATSLQNGGFTDAEIENAFGSMRVETLGGAAWSYPDGPRYVHYVNEYDPVAFHFGLAPYGLSDQERLEIQEGVVEPVWMKRLTAVMSFLDVERFAPLSPGRDGKLVRFRVNGDDWLDAHGIDVYLVAHRPFETAYSGIRDKPFIAGLLPFFGVGIKWLGISMIATWVGRKIRAGLRWIRSALGKKIRCATDLAFGRTRQESYERISRERCEPVDRPDSTGERAVQ